MDKTQMSVLALIAMFLGAGVVYNVSDYNKTYYCSTKDIYKICDRLSSTEKTCYFNGGSATCTNGLWKKVTVLLDSPPISPVNDELKNSSGPFTLNKDPNGNVISCNIDGFIDPAYLGRLEDGNCVR